MAELRLSGLQVGYGRQPVLAGLSLSIPSGALTAVLGPNGAGKTTLLRGIAGILPLQAGQVDWHSAAGKIALHLLRPRERARLVAYVPQLVANEVPLTVGEALAVASRAGGGTIEQQATEAAATLAALALEAQADQPCNRLSGGLWRRVLVAQGLVQRAPLLLLDEPTAFLDPPARHELLELLRQLARDRDLCIVCVLHDPQLALAYAGRAVALAPGRLLASGSATEVLSPHVLKELYGAGEAWLHKEQEAYRA
jgi:iron complex transport system ATP-binding protein